MVDIYVYVMCSAVILYKTFMKTDSPIHYPHKDIYNYNYPGNPATYHIND